MAMKQHQNILLPVTWGVMIRSSIFYLIPLLFACIVVIVFFSTGERGRLVIEENPVIDKNKSPGGGNDDLSSSPPLLPPLQQQSSPPPWLPPLQQESSLPPLEQCNLFDGKWIYDNKSYPLYKEKECSFMSDQLACEKYGRKDLSYQNWRWQPHHCDLPRFNGTALLERLRGKRLVFVGDSLNRGQWVSMVCLVEKSIPSNLKSMKSNGSLTTFKAIEYNASIEFYWAPLLVESNSDDPIAHRVPERIVKVQAIEKHARHWTDADILVFNSYLWWRRPQMKILWGSFDSPDGIYKDVEMPRCYEMALKTWADWIEIHVNRSKTQLFFVSLSPTHERAEEWGGISGQNCYGETEVITKEGYLGSGSDPKIMQAVESTIDELKTRGLQVQIINITQLSEYRKEGHPTIYRKQWEPLSEEQLAKPISYADCDHWCLPGVPDSWNELLYSFIFS